VEKETPTHFVGFSAIGSFCLPKDTFVVLSNNEAICVSGVCQIILELIANRRLNRPFSALIHIQYPSVANPERVEPRYDYFTSTPASRTSASCLVNFRLVFERLLFGAVLPKFEVSHSGNCDFFQPNRLTCIGVTSTGK